MIMRRLPEDPVRRKPIPAHRDVGRILALCAITACAGEPLPTGTSAPGASGQIVLTSVAWAGGHGYREVTRIDSATGRYSVHACVESHGAAACDPSGVVREGAVLPNLLRDAFARTQRPDFRVLRAHYHRPPGETPPDPAQATLELTANERRRTITWDQGATIPMALTDFVCILMAARGDLLLCD